MTYDEELAHRVRGVLGPEPGITERAMFGGLAFLVRGNMALAVSRQGGLLVRVDPATADRLTAVDGVETAVMGGRQMRGWLRVAPGRLSTKRQLATWVRRGAGYARSRPPKGTGGADP